MSTLANKLFNALHESKNAAEIDAIEWRVINARIVNDITVAECNNIRACCRLKTTLIIQFLTVSPQGGTITLLKQTTGQNMEFLVTFKHNNKIVNQYVKSEHDTLQWVIQAYASLMKIDDTSASLKGMALMKEFDKPNTVKAIENTNTGAKMVIQHYTPT